MGAAEAEPLEDERGPTSENAGAIHGIARSDAAALHASRARLSGHLGWNLGADVLARGASLWLSLFCARVLEVDAFGRFCFALAAAQYAWLAGDAALNAGYATRETARRPDPDQAATFWGARLTAAAAVTVAYLVVVASVPVVPETRRTLAAGATFFLAYASFPDWALRGLADFRGLARANAVYAVTLVAATVALLPGHPDPALAAALWGGCFALAAAVSVTGLARRGRLHPRPRLAPAGWWPHARRSSVFAVGSIAAIGYAQLPILLSGALLPAREVGLFSAGFRLLIAFIGALTIVWWPLMPVLTRERPEHPQFRDALQQTSALVLTLGTLVALTLAWFAVPILTGLFGAGYAGGATALAIGAWALPLYALSGLLEQTSLALGLERRRAVVSWTTLVMMTLMAVWIVPRFGAAGAAAVSVAGFGFTLAQYAWRLRARIRLADVFAPLPRVGIACGALALLWTAGTRLTSLSPWVWIGAGAPVYLLLAGRLGLLHVLPGMALPWARR